MTKLMQGHLSITQRDYPQIQKISQGKREGRSDNQGCGPEK